MTQRGGQWLVLVLLEFVSNGKLLVITVLVAVNCAKNYALLGFEAVT